jgi:hypothetical protein
MRLRHIEVFHAINLLTSANAPLAQSARRLVKYIGEAASKAWRTSLDQL